MADPTIKIIPNGPYRVTGPITITDPQGNVDPDRRRTAAFRSAAAAHSSNKPYCDGTHGPVGFDVDGIGRQELIRLAPRLRAGPRARG